MRHFIFTVVVCLATQFTYSQEKDSCYAGVYITQDDFVHNRLSHKIYTGEKGNKLDFTFPADLTLTVKLVTPDSTLKFDPGNIYGYNDCGKIFRYFHGGKELNAQEDYYRVEEMAGLIIYSSAFVSGVETFYSRSLTDSIHRLTMKNLERDFKGHNEFIRQAKKLNKEPDDGLATKDEKDNYRINTIYRETIKVNE